MTNLGSTDMYSADQENDVTYPDTIDTICEGRTEVFRVDTQDGFGEVETFPAKYDSDAATQAWIVESDPITLCQQMTCSC